MKRILLIAGLLAAAPLHAQTDTTRVQRLQRLYPGINMRLQVADEYVISPFLRATPDSVYVQSGAFALSDAQSIAIQQRATRRGAKVGAITGAIGGAGFGAFLMFLVTYMCESDCTDNEARDIALGTVGFSAFGTLAGAAVGGVIGAATPQWFELTDPRVRIPSVAPVSKTIGSFSASPVYARYSEVDAGGAGVRVAYTFQAGPVAFGPELGMYALDNNTNIRHAGGIARIGTGADKRVEPFGSAGVGFYSWGREFGGSIQLGGYSLGGGVHLKSTDRKRSLFTEARWQNNLTNSGDTNPQYGFYTLGIGGQISW